MTMPDVSAIRRAIDAANPELIGLSEAIHAHPEVNFEEVEASARCVSLLRDHGFTVTTPLCDLPTAFDATFGSGSLHIAFLAEYDALPDVGHACGHNIIAASSVGAGIGLAARADELDLTVHVMGTPAEEGGAGKVLLLDRGAFAGIHAALMVHPWSVDRLDSACLAVDHFDVSYEGRTAHASAAPWQGINAADAMTIAQVSLGLLRQQLPAGDQVHGIITHGGEAANIIPGHVTARFMIRSLSEERLEVLRERVLRCFEAGALATRASWQLKDLAPRYTHMTQDRDLLALYRSEAERLGRRFDADDAGEAPLTYSTDMANISLALPAIHPLISLDTKGAVNHQPEFTAACIGDSANHAIIDAAIALAETAAQAATTPLLRQRLLA